MAAQADTPDSYRPGTDLVAKADAVMNRVLDGERVPRAQVDAAMAVLRRIPIGREAPGQTTAKPAALHIHVDHNGVITEGRGTVDRKEL